MVERNGSLFVLNNVSGKNEFEDFERLFIEVSNSLNELISSLRLQNSKVKNVYMNYRPARGAWKSGI